MDLRYKKQASCPSDEMLLAYKTRRLIGEERDEVAFHLLFCDACVEVLQQLPAEAEGEVETEEQEVADLKGEVGISPELAEAIEKFRAREKRRRERLVKTLEEVLAESGLKVGQIWRTRFDGITLPSREKEEPFSVADLDSTPHLVVITEVQSGTRRSYGDHHVTQVAPISAETEYASEGDFVIKEEESPLGYSFMIELWNEQSMLRENLDCCLGALDPTEHKEILEKLRQGREELHRERKKPLSLEETVMKGLYHEPIMRFRAHEYEETAYLRVPVEALRELLAEESVADVELLDLAAYEGRPPGTQDKLEQRTSLVFVDTLEIEELNYDVLADPISGNVFLRPSPKDDKTLFILSEKSYVLEKVEGNNDLSQIVGLGIGELQRFCAMRRKDPNKYRLALRVD